jgi:hypothetical protein
MTLSHAFKQPKNPPIVPKEIELRETYAHIFKESVTFEKMLKAMGDMRAGCKIGIRYVDRTLYVDTPSILQGAVRWLYGQTRDNIKQYISDEIMGSNGFIELLQHLRTTCDQVMTYCATPTMGPNISNDIRLAFRNVCAANVNLIMRISHGISRMIITYEVDDTSLSMCKYLEYVQRTLKIERIILETSIINFAKYIK